MLATTGAATTAFTWRRRFSDSIRVGAELFALGRVSNKESSDIIGATPFGVFGDITFNKPITLGASAQFARRTVVDNNTNTNASQAGGRLGLSADVGVPLTERGKLMLGGIVYASSPLVQAENNAQVWVIPGARLRWRQDGGYLGFDVGLVYLLDREGVAYSSTEAKGTLSVPRASADDNRPSSNLVTTLGLYASLWTRAW